MRNYLKTFAQIVAWLVATPLKWFWINIPRSKYRWSLLLNAATLVYITWFVLLFPIVYAQAPEVVTIQREKPTKEEVSSEKKQTPPVGSKEWVLWYVEKEGIDPVKVDCLITYESGWNPNNKHVNSANSIDLGLYQWSSKYQIDPGFISLDCVGDPECETYKFIEKVKQDQNFEAWHAYTNHCLWLGTNPFIK